MTAGPDLWQQPHPHLNLENQKSPIGFFYSVKPGHAPSERRPRLHPNQTTPIPNIDHAPHKHAAGPEYCSKPPGGSVDLDQTR